MNAEYEKATDCMDLVKACTIMGQLGSRGVETVLYGSLGASVYLGDFKAFGDVDFIAAPEWMSEKWGELQTIMTELGFRLVNEKEHEFRDASGVSVAFAPLTIFARDGIDFDAQRDIAAIDVEGGRVRTFTAELFKRAYEYSARDGYRRDERGKKDQSVIDLLDEYISSKAQKTL